MILRDGGNDDFPFFVPVGLLELYPHLTNLLPAEGYGGEMLRDLEATSPTLGDVLDEFVQRFDLAESS